MLEGMVFRVEFRVRFPPITKKWSHSLVLSRSMFSSKVDGEVDLQDQNFHCNTKMCIIRRRGNIDLRYYSKLQNGMELDKACILVCHARIVTKNSKCPMGLRYFLVDMWSLAVGNRWCCRGSRQHYRWAPDLRLPRSFDVDINVGHLKFAL